MQRVHRGQVLKARDVNSLRSRGTFARGVFNSAEGVVQRSRKVASGGGVADSGTGKIEWLQIADAETHPMTASLYTFNANGTWTFVSHGHQLYRPPTHTTNDMFKYGGKFAAVKIADGVYLALHATPRQFEIYG